MSGVNLFRSQDQVLTDSQRAFLKSVAGMAYGTGFLEGEKGGKGNMGLWCDSEGRMHVIKFNTHGSQADQAQKALSDAKGILSASQKGMLASSDLLRIELRKIADQLGMSLEAQKALLGDAEGKPELLTRRVVAKFVSAAQAHKMAGDTLADIWSDGATIASKSDMSFDAVIRDAEFMGKDTAVGDLDADAMKMFTALSVICSSVDNKKEIPAFDTGISFNGRNLHLRLSKKGMVQYQYAPPGKVVEDEKDWVTCRVTARGLRSRIWHECLRSDGAFRKNASAVLAEMQRWFDAPSATARQQNEIRQKCVQYLKERSGLNNDKFANASTRSLLHIARQLSEQEMGTAEACDVVLGKLADYALKEDVGLDGSLDILSLVKTAKEDVNIEEKVQLEAPGINDSKPKAEDGSDKFRRLAADLIKPYNTLSVDEKLHSPNMETKIAEEREYIASKMRILDLSEEDLEKSSEEVRRQHAELVKQLQSCEQTAKMVPGKLLMQRFAEKIRDDARRGEKNFATKWIDGVVESEYGSRLEEFKKSAEEAQKLTIKIGEKDGELVIDRYDRTLEVSVYVDVSNESSESEEWVPQPNIPLLTALRGMFGKDVYGARFSFWRGGPEGHEIEMKQLEELWKQMEASEVHRPTKDEVRNVVLDEKLTELVENRFFTEDGKFSPDLVRKRYNDANDKVATAMQNQQNAREDYLRVNWNGDTSHRAKRDADRHMKTTSFWKAVQTANEELEEPRFYFKLVEKVGTFSKEHTGIRARELLCRQLLESRSQNNNELASHEMVESWRLLEVFKEHKEALVEFIQTPDQAMNSSTDSAVNDILSALNEDGALCQLFGISESDKLSESVVIDKIDSFIRKAEKGELGSSAIIRSLNARIRDLVDEQLMQAQQEFDHLVDDAFERIYSGRTTWQFSSFSIINNRVSAKDITDEKKKKELEDVVRHNAQFLESWSEGELFKNDRGYDAFLKSVLKGYFTKLPFQSRLNMVSSRIRHSHDGASRGERLGGLLKGAGPLLLKMLQAFNPPTDSDLNVAFADMKTNLSPIPQEVLQAHLLDIVNRSGGRIEKITVKKTLGSASVGQTLLCHVEGPGVLKRGGMDVVVKILRPDAMNKLIQERDFLLECAKDIKEKTGDGKMEAEVKAIFEKTLEEFDLTVEANNIKSSKVYNGKVQGVRTLNELPIVEPESGTLVIEIAPGKTVATIVNDIEATYRISSMGESEYTSQPGNPYATIISKYKMEEEKMSHKDLKYKAPDRQREVLKEIKERIQELRSVHDGMSKLLEVWAKECLTEEGSGFYHGDLHGGNIMFDPAKGLTTIDFGNASFLDGKSRKAFIKLLELCSKVSNFKLVTHLLPGDEGVKVEKYRDDVSMEWIKKDLSGLADQVRDLLVEILSPDQKVKFLQEYNSTKWKVECKHIDDAGGKDAASFSYLKHEIMLALSAPGFSPEPFTRLKTILTRLECNKIELPQSFIRFMTAASRLMNEIDNIRNSEFRMRQLLNDRVKDAPCTAAPDVFGFLRKLTMKSGTDDKTGILRITISKPDMSDSEVSARKLALGTMIRQARDGGENAWERFKKNVGWLGDEELMRKVDEFKNNPDNTSDDAVSALASEICVRDLDACENMARVYQEEIDNGMTSKKNPYERESFNLLDFTQLFSRVIAKSA